MSMARGASSVLEEMGAEVVEVVLVVEVLVEVLVVEDGVIGAAGGGATLLELDCLGAT